MHTMFITAPFTIGMTWQQPKYPLTAKWIKKMDIHIYIYICTEITADGDCSHEIKRRLLLGRKVMTYLDSILKSQ